MKKIQSLCLCLACVLMCGAALAEDGLWTVGTLDYQGHSIGIHAIVQEELPEELCRITITGRPIKNKEIMQALGQHFELHPAFEAGDSMNYDNTLTSMWTDGYSRMAAYDARCFTEREAEDLFPITDPELEYIYASCLSFLESLDITAVANTGYVCRKHQYGCDTTIVLLPYRISGLFTEYMNQIVNRRSQPPAGKAALHILDYPWAAFAFDEQHRLVKLELATLQATGDERLTGQPIPWQQAAEGVLDAFVEDRISMRRDIHGFTDYDEEQFWKHNRVQISRVMPMWMPNNNNVCLPGWCIQLQLYDAEIGTFLSAYSYCADLFTGEVAQYRPER